MKRFQGRGAHIMRAHKGAAGLHEGISPGINALPLRLTTRAEDRVAGVAES